jgi:hypothetical protein
LLLIARTITVQDSEAPTSTTNRAGSPALEQGGHLL